MSLGLGDVRVAGPDRRMLPFNKRALATHLRINVRCCIYYPNGEMGREGGIFEPRVMTQGLKEAPHGINREWHTRMPDHPKR